jgi:hypothetical protein
MSERPTEELLEDPAEIGRCGCLLPDIEDDGPSTPEEDDDDE